MSSGSRTADLGSRQDQAASGIRRPLDQGSESFRIPDDGSRIPSTQRIMKPTVLIVDDEAGVRSALSGVLRDEGYDVETVESGEACLDRVGRAPYDVIVLDIWLPGMDGLVTLARLR